MIAARSVLAQPFSARQPVRLRMAPDGGSHRLDGGWWPQSRDLAVEIAELAENLPAAWGRIDHAVVSPPDWDSSVHRAPIGRGYVKIGVHPEDDTHLILLVMSTRRIVQLLVVPFDTPIARAMKALHHASTPDNSAAAAAVLQDQDDADWHSEKTTRRWQDDGGAWVESLGLSKRPLRSRPTRRAKH